MMESDREHWPPDWCHLTPYTGAFKLLFKEWRMSLRMANHLFPLNTQTQPGTHTHMHTPANSLPTPSVGMKSVCLRLIVSSQHSHPHGWSALLSLALQLDLSLHEDRETHSHTCRHIITHQIHTLQTYMLKSYWNSTYFLTHFHTPWYTNSHSLLIPAENTHISVATHHDYSFLQLYKTQE